MSTIVGEDIGKRIKTRLDILGKTEKQLADEIFVSSKLISHYVTGVSVPPVDRIVQIATVLNCSTDELLGHECSVTEKNEALWKVMEFIKELMK